MKAHIQKLLILLLGGALAVLGVGYCGNFDAHGTYLGYDYLLNQAASGQTATPALIQVSLISGNTTELGGTATFTVVLGVQPTANVIVGVSSSDLTEGTVSPASLTFTTANWNTPQTVTVTGVMDYIADGTQAYQIITAPAISADSKFNGVDPADVLVYNLDSAITYGSFVVSAISGDTTEFGGTATFTVRLGDAPTANVTIGVASDDLTEGTVSTSSLTFTPANWGTDQTVTVTGVDDAILDGNIIYHIVLSPDGTTTDGRYNGVDPPDVTVTNDDNESMPGGVIVSAISGHTTEFGGTATFTVRLGDAPTSDVTIALSSDNTAQGTVSPASLTFTSINWGTDQTVTVTGVNDLVQGDGNITYHIVTAPAVSADIRYNGVDPADVTVVNDDNDSTPGGITVSAISGMTTESGGTATFTVVLTDQPATNVLIGVSSDDVGEGTPDTASLTFTSGNWNSPQTVTVTGVDDTIADGRQTYHINLAASSSTDPRYNNLPAQSVTVINQDNEWLPGYTYRRRITFGTSHSILYKGYTATFTTDTSNAALASGNDVRIVYHKADGSTGTSGLELDRLGSGWKGASNTTSFRLQYNIAANANEDGLGSYFVYYGNGAAGAPPADEMNVYYFADFFDRGNSTNLNTVTNRNWTEYAACAGDMRILSNQIQILPMDMVGCPVQALHVFSLGAIPDNFIATFNWTLWAQNVGPGTETTWSFWGLHIGNSTMVNGDISTGVGPGLYHCEDSGFNFCANTVDTLAFKPDSISSIESGVAKGSHSFVLTVDITAHTYFYNRDSGAKTGTEAFVTNANGLDRVRIGATDFQSGDYDLVDNLKIYLNPATPPTVSAASTEEIQ